MPIYEYICKKCAYKFEELRPIGKADEPLKCPKCGETARRIQSTFGVGGSKSSYGSCPSTSSFT